MANIPGGVLDGLSKNFEITEGSGDRTTDSNEHISNKIGAYTGDGGAAADDSVKAELDLIKTKTDTIAGSSVSIASATTTGVIVADGTTGTPNIVTVQSGDANTFGNWVQLDASVSADSWLCCVTVGQNGTWFAGGNTVEIGIGAAPNEATKVRFSFYTSASQYLTFVYTIPIPIKVANGTRIAARTAIANPTVNMKISISMYQSLE